jgi:hypothetical protein
MEDWMEFWERLKLLGIVAIIPPLRMSHTVHVLSSMR